MIEQGDLVSVPVDWDKPDYWNVASLDRELRRQYDVCNSCRLCFNLCPGFPKLFVHFDRDEVDNDPDKLSNDQVGEFVDLCYNCKLCFIKCPYTPPHKFLIDIPRLVMRARAVEAKKSGVELRERMLSSPDEVGRIAKYVAPVINWANKSRFNRRIMERFFGVHRDKILPMFAQETFADWFRRNFVSAQFVATQTGPKVAIFHTCIVNYNEPQVGRAMVRVLDRNNAQMKDVGGQVCCGMPYLDSGRLDEALEHFRQNIRVLLPLVRNGYDIVIPEPTCGMMFKKEYADYLKGEERQQASEIAQRTFDLCEYLVKLNAAGGLDRNFQISVGKIAYHQPCHLKYQAIGAKSIELLRLSGAEVIFIDKGCSGHDGTWAMKKEYFEMAQKVARGLHRGVRESSADMVATDCALAGIQITQGTDRKTVHPVEVLARAYGLPTD